jgi:hypothetical protein
MFSAAVALPPENPEDHALVNGDAADLIHSGDARRAATN